MRYLFLLLFIALNIQLQAQIGFNAKVVGNDAEKWTLSSLANLEGRDNQLLNDGYSFGVDYWIRLESTRIDFLPEFNYSNFSTTILPDEIELNSTFYSFLVNANIYFLNLEGDCTCPTFYQEGPSLQKGLFLNVSPGLHYFEGKLSDAENELRSNDLTFSIGGGIGFDIGFSEFITVTPIAQIRYFPSVIWEGANEFINSINEQVEDENTTLLQLSAGIRIGLLF
ncbi:MAG: hypothetical protein AAFO07_06645 [Bacteroidota bacterium]